MNINDGSNIDNIRVYPEDASIQNYQYDFKGLKTLETNNFGLTTRYYYDNRGRVSYIMDHDNNIINSYEYNNIEVYVNDEKKQDFFKQGCPVGYAGERITYLVPKGKYSSTISVENANQKAIDDINFSGQNYANTTGTCMPSCYRYRISIPIQRLSNIDL